MAPSAEVVVGGHICLDVIPELFSRSALPEAGQLSLIGPATFATGGPVANTGLALDRLGIKTKLMGKVGEDAFGKIITDLIESRNPELADGIISVPGETTSYTIVLSFPHCDRAFMHCPGANDTFNSSDLKMEQIAQARLFHFGYPPLLAHMYAKDGVELIETFQKVKGLGVTTALDMVMIDPDSPAGEANWEAILRAVLPAVDLFFPSIEEILVLLRRPFNKSQWVQAGSTGEQLQFPFLRKLAGQLLDWGAKAAVLKMGAYGIYMRTGKIENFNDFGAAQPADLDDWANREIWAPIFKIDQFGGNTGAGDSAIAGFISALLRNKSPEETMMFACATGACNVEAADALSGLKTWEATWARIADGWERIPMQRGEPGWQLDASTQVWLGPFDKK